MAHAERRAVVESYIVRIYRRNRNSRSTVHGVVEDVETQDRRAFRDGAQLYEILRVGGFLSVGLPARTRGRRAGNPES